jgi:hypothetical protein
MAIFELSTNVIPRVIEEFSKAEQYIRIAIFQLHNEGIFNLLNEKLSEGINVEIITLPYDSIHEDVRDEVVIRFDNLIRNGAILNFCRWNVGDPERTSTAVGRWYSFHGKFTVTDKSAIALSANFMESNELDAILIYENDANKINEFNEKFDELIDLLIRDHSGYSGAIRQRIQDTNLPGALSLFDLPPVIETDTHINHWIQHYPSVLCPESVPIEDKIYLAPFDSRGRNLYKSIINEADEYIYISTESYTDTDFAEFLRQIKLKGVDIKILTGAVSMDFSDRMQKMLRELLAHDIKVRTIDGSLHAKLLITDKHLVVSSVNLNKMNLGFSKTRRYWRENTETITICSESDVINSGRTQFLDVFDNGVDIEDNLAKKIESGIGRMYSSTFGLRSRKEVKILFARLVLQQEIQVKKLTLTIGRITSMLMKHFSKTMVEKDDFIMALILFYLSERKHDYDQINEKLSALSTEIKLTELLCVLTENEFIEQENDFYKIRIETLF